jgi:hypothetical protein
MADHGYAYPTDIAPPPRLSPADRRRFLVCPGHAPEKRRPGVEAAAGAWPRLALAIAIED